MTRDEIIAWIIANDEGGLVTLAGDPGGTTYKGISQRFLDIVHTQHPELPHGGAELTDAQVAQLYVDYFLTPIRGDNLPSGLALAMMDMAVNEGAPAAVMNLQRALGLTVDARFGPATMAAVDAISLHPGSLLEEFTARRCVEYAKLEPTSGQFELGWMRRALRVYALSV